ncbi:rhodanese-like domain-containing protein [Peribacillus loiseleuriae]|uniref:Rhodanese n=1 Tax=Peribacillus loiseleuriae TaxID=1679170 RepID=A0A0K9GQY6_9BACI|nr:rhodanese-like domain-containing protein [Peribacillus loiseleuriae]KMY48692.1 rhodanese [Peribacillus loiseleuriae]
MEYVNYIVIALFLVFIIQRVLPTRGVRQITTTDLKNELNDKNKQYIDVRTSGEFKARNIRGFKNIPLHQLAQQAVSELSKEKEIVVICQSGMRSNKASKILKKQGFKQVTNVKGGMSAWC